MVWAGPRQEPGKLWVYAQEWGGKAEGPDGRGKIWGLFGGTTLKKPVVGGYGLWPDGRGWSIAQWVRTEEELEIAGLP